MNQEETADEYIRKKVYYSNGGIMFMHESHVYIGFPDCRTCGGTGKFAETYPPYSEQCYGCQLRFSSYDTLLKACNNIREGLARLCNAAISHHMKINIEAYFKHPAYLKWADYSGHLLKMQKPYPIKEEYYDSSGTLYKSVLIEPPATQ